MCDTQTKTEPRPIAEIVREMTDDGRLIVEFLLDMVQGKMEGATYWHRLEATRQLEKLGLEIPRTVIQSNSGSTNGPSPSRASGNSRQIDELADIIKEETADGRYIVRFLVDVMQGKLEGFKPRHRLVASNELLKRGFDNVPDHTGADDDGDDDSISRERLDNKTRRNTKQYNDDDDPFDFDNYNLEDYERDRMGRRAEVHIFGSEEALEVALNANRKYGNEKSAGAHIPDYDYSPIKNPGDDPYGKGCYGYKVLRIGFQDNNRIRAINKAVAQYHKRKFKHLIKKNGSSSTWGDTASLDPGTLQYLERNRQLLAEKDGPSETPKPSVGVGFKPTRDSEEPPAPEPPPRKKRLKIHLSPPGEDPPDDNPRQRGDPEEIRIPLKNLWSTSAIPP